MEDEDLKITTGQGVPPVSSEGAPPPAGEPPAVSKAEPLAVSKAEPPPEILPPETLEPSAVPPGAGEAGKSGRFFRALKTMLAVVIVAAIVGGVGAIGYFVIFPLLFPPTDQIIPKLPVPPAVKITHQTYLVLPPAAEAEIEVASRSYAALAAALQNEAFAQLADGQLKEVKISDRSGQIPFADYLAAVAPSSGALDLSGWFEGDFTALLYYNPAGVWPIYVARLKQGVDPAAVLSGFRSLEDVLETGNFYLTSPGSFAGFKDGKYKNYADRYNVGTQLGASFNYGIFGRYLILATNFDGLKAALPLLGL